MRVSENWLREWINPSVDTQQLADLLTMAGLEVDGVEPAAGKFSGVVVAKVLEVEAHPDAKKLQVCKVDDGKGEISNVICGASNVRKDLKVAFAKVGATLPGNFKIEAKELRGVESFGMLCSASELGLTESSDGIMELSDDLELGTDVYKNFALDDQIIDIDLTPNRSDCLSMQGVAREVSALLDQSLENDFKVGKVKNSIDSTFPVSIHAADACPRYVGRVIEGVSGTVQSPLWMQEKLRRAGVRAINAITDITNFVMLEIGQPMHAFDMDTLNAGIDIRMAKSSEKLELLDGQEIELSDDELVIADAKQPIALAGIMGGLATAIQADTKNIFLESAHFKPEVIAGKARRRGLHTDSSHRFERGVDPDLASKAIERATQLILEIVGGKVGPIICEEPASLSKPSQITLLHSKVESLLGITISIQEVQKLLQRLNCEVDVKDESLVVVPPSYRFDLALDVDLIEEVARLVGYKNIPADVKALAVNTTSANNDKSQLKMLKEALVLRDYHEVITFSFVDQEIDELLNPQHVGKRLANPISNDLAVMRGSIWPGLIKAAQYNLNRQQSRIRMFEQGLQFINTAEGLQQNPCLAGLIIGDSDPEQWGASSHEIDFYDLKGDVEQLLKISAVCESQIKFVRSDDASMHPGQSAEIKLGKKLVGRLGKLHPRIQSALGIDAGVYLFELQLNELLSRVDANIFQPISKYPANRRDINVIVDKSVSVAEIRSNIEQMHITSLQNIKVLSIYHGKGIPETKKSVSLGLILQEFSRTLTDKELEQTVLSIISQLKNKVGAEIRS